MTMFEGLQLYQKETPAPMLEFFCGYCKTFKNTYFEEYLRTVSSGKLTLDLNGLIKLNCNLNSNLNLEKEEK